MTNETALFLQAQAAWAVAQIVYHSLFRITVIFKCLISRIKTAINDGLEESLPNKMLLKGEWI